MRAGGSQPLNDEARDAIGRRWARSFAAWRWLVRPVFFGHEHVPAHGPAIWAGNHSLLALADACLMVAELYERHGIVLRALGLHQLRFFPPVSPDEFAGMPLAEGALAMRQEVERIVQGGIEELLACRERDERRPLRARLL